MATLAELGEISKALDEDDRRRYGQAAGVAGLGAGAFGGGMYGMGRFQSKKGGRQYRRGTAEAAERMHVSEGFDRLGSHALKQANATKLPKGMTHDPLRHIAGLNFNDARYHREAAQAATQQAERGKALRAVGRRHMKIGGRTAAAGLGVAGLGGLAALAGRKREE